MLNSTRSLFVLLFVGVISVSLDVTAPPPTAVEPYLNGIFPESIPGAAGAWELEDPMPQLTVPAPVNIISFPGSSDILLLSKMGEVWRVSIETQTKKLLLDIKDRTFRKGEAGAVGIALHPRFGDPSAPDKQELFFFYRSKPEPDEWSEKGYNRLAKFNWDPNSETFDPDSEEILIQQYDRHTWHNGGGMFFGNDEFLYLSLGDEGSGFEEHPDYQTASTQKINGGFFSGVIRIDVDNDSTRSHPIRRQPMPNASPQPDWWPTYSQGYFIPNDNPWLSSDSLNLEEFYSIGSRSPYSMNYDKESQQIWIADVGSDIREEISLVEKGDNLQWPYQEGSVISTQHQKPDLLIGNEKEAYFEYKRSIGTCIIGAGVYRGSRFPDLYGKYLFADYTVGFLKALETTGSGLELEAQTILSSIKGQGVIPPLDSGVTDVFFTEDGQVLLTVMGAELETPGKIFRLKSKQYVPDPPAKLSELGVFTDLTNLIPVPGLIPYEVNAPLWSDRALKRRWLAIPNDGDFDEIEEKVKFSSSGEWRFPDGTVFVKHFELPKTTDPDGETRRLETRFFVIGKGGTGYGLTYQWNEEETDATLLLGAASKDFDIYEDGEIVFTQTWDFPNRDQCLRCHSDNAKYILGVNTHQLNGTYDYPELEGSKNQLDYLNDLGVFHREIGQANDYPKSAQLEDESADLDLRIRSYLDANCAFCHRQNGIATVNLDLRFGVPLNLKNIVNHPTRSEVSSMELLVKPGDHSSSELWTRDASTTENKMPPLARNIVDQVYIDALAEWIDQLSPSAGLIHDLVLYPNPSNGWLNIRLSDDWIPGFKIRVRALSGKIVYEEISDLYSLNLNLNNVPAGVYILEVFNGNNEKKQVQKFLLF